MRENEQSGGRADDDYPYFVGPTLDDVMRATIKAIWNRGDRNNATKGVNKELTGVLLEITQPRARLSRTETRGKPFSCLGELCWYLAGTNELEFISYYIGDYRQYAEGSQIFGGYGPRLFQPHGLNQIANVTRLLKENPESRRAVVQIFDAGDLAEEHVDIPCTCSLQFMVRRGELQMVTHMRSNDVFLGLPHDVFAFTMLQEIMARDLSTGLGTYKHFVGSLHLYDRDEERAKQFLGEGYQPTDLAMPAMPVGDPWPALQMLGKAEAVVRCGGTVEFDQLDKMDPYWADLVRLLQVFRYSKDGNISGIEATQAAMASPIYTPFIVKKLSKYQNR